ncbi:O-antigen ligase family protein [Micromonospora zamorensis]|uniref:O-antigen ligase family protein n=1 Tax=Micromonospora zamorensis TaxID=709883 RepID=UPI0033CE2985
MGRSAVVFAWVGALALALGILASWRPVLLVVLVLAAVAGWGLWTPQRLNHLLFGVLLLVPATAAFGYPVEPVWVILLVGTIVACFGRIQRFHPDAPFGSPGLLGFVLPAVCLLTALVNTNRPKDLVAALVPFVCYAVITWHVVDEARRDPGAMRRTAQVFAWIGVPLAILSIYQRVTGTWPVLDEFTINEAFTAHAGAGRSVGTLGHPIVYGTFCMLGMCVALALRGRMWQVPFVAGAIGLLLSGSRSVWIGTAAALVVWYLSLERKVTRRGIYIAVSSVVIGGGLVAIGPGPVGEVTDILRARLTNVTGQSSATARYVRTEEAWAGVWHSPGTVLLGQGPEAHVRFFEQVGVNDGLAQTFDNSYLTLWYDFGIFPLLIFVGALVAVLLKYKSLAARMLITGFAVQIWFFDFFLWPAAAATLILAIGLAVAESSPVQPGTESQRSYSERPAFVR